MPTNMKLSKTLLLLLVFIGFLSCGNDDDSEVETEEFLTAILDENEFIANTGGDFNALTARVNQGANGTKLKIVGLRGYLEVVGLL